MTITHLPQIASVADRHFRVEKVPGDPTHTRIEPLDADERREELERMLGGAEFCDSAARSGLEPTRRECSRSSVLAGHAVTRGVRPREDRLGVSRRAAPPSPDWWPGIPGVQPDRRGFAPGARWRSCEQRLPLMGWRDAGGSR